MITVELAYSREHLQVTSCYLYFSQTSKGIKGYKSRNGWLDQQNVHTL